MKRKDIVGVAQHRGDPEPDGDEPYEQGAGS